MKASNKSLIIILISAIIIIGLIARCYNLTLDPPMLIGTFSQDLATDPYHITSFASNKAKFGQWEFFEYPNWQVFKVSISSLIAYLLYSIGSTNLLWTNLAGVIQSFIGTLLFLIAIRINQKDNGWMPVLIAALFISMNFILITYSRAPFLETGVILYFGLIVLLLQGKDLSTSRLIIVSVLVSLACLSGRIFSITIGMALMASILTSDNEKKLRKIGILIAGGFVSGAILLFLLYGDRIGAYFAYLSEHSDTSRGNLYILTNLIDFITMPVSFGTESRLYYDSPFLFIGTYISIVFAIISIRKNYGWFRNNFNLQFSLWWILFLFCFFFPFNYRPLRYSLLIYFPFILLISSMYSMNKAKTLNCPKFLARIVTVTLFSVNLYFLIHMVLDFFMHDNYPSNPQSIYLLLIIPAALLTWIMTANWSKSGLSFINRRIPLILLVISVLSFGYQAYSYYDWLRHSHSSTDEIFRDASELLNLGAAVAGPHAPRMTMYSDNKPFIYYFGLSKPDSSIFETYPLTHLVVDQYNFNAAVKDFPEVNQGIVIADYLIRGRTILLIYIPNLQVDYNLSVYELAEKYYKTGDLDSATILNTKFLTEHPQNISGLKQAYRINYAKSDANKCLNSLHSLYRYHPNNIDVLYFCAMNYKEIGLAFKRQDLTSLSLQCLNQAKWLYKDFGHHLQNAYNEIR